MRQRRLITAAALFLGVMGLVSACSSPQPATSEKDNKAAAPAPKPITAEERVKWYQDCWNDFNEKKWDEFKKCYADNATSQQLGYGTPNATGPDAIVASSQEFVKAVPDGRGEGQLILVNGNHIAGVYILKGANIGPLLGPDGKEIPPTNKKFGLLFGHLLDADPAALKVVKEIGVMDGGSFAYQLGLSKNPGRPVMEKGEAMPKVVIAKNDETEMKNLDIEKAQLEAFNKHDAVAVDMYEAEDFIFHDTTSPKDMNKKQGSDSNKEFWKAFSDAKLDTTSLWAAGDYVAINGTFSGTNDGDFPSMKLKKTGKKVSLPYLEIDRLEAGKLKEGWLFFDSTMFASQLGLK